MDIKTKILVIPGNSLNKEPYESTVEEECKRLHISEKQIAKAISTGQVLKQHYFDIL